MKIYNAKSYLVRKTNSTAMKLLSEHLTIDHTHPLKRNVYFMLWLHTDLQGDSTSPSLKEISPEYSLVGPDAKSSLIGKDPDAGKD